MSDAWEGSKKSLAPYPAPQDPLTCPSIPRPSADSSMGNRKRQRVTVNGPSDETSLQSTHASPSHVELPRLPLIYHLALASHLAAHRHLQQAFIPSDIACGAADNDPPVLSSASDDRVYSPDPLAAQKWLALMLFSLDLLRNGLADNQITEKERVFFGLQFGTVAIKIMSTCQMDGKGKERERNGVNLERLTIDAQDIVGTSLFIATKQKYLRTVADQLEIINVKLAFLRDRGNAARRMVRQALSDPTKISTGHRVHLLLLLIEHGGAVSLNKSLLDELDLVSRASGSLQILQLAHIVRLRQLFQHRQWGSIEAALGTLTSSIDDPSSEDPANFDQAWTTHLNIHLLMLRVLWAGRIGDDATAKSLLKKLYAIMDEALDCASMALIRSKAGLIEIPLSAGPPVLVQITPPNVTYLMTYLVSVVSRRNVLGTDSSCKSLVLSRAMQETAHRAKAEELWDLDFSASHGLADAHAIRSEVFRAQIETTLEQITAMMFRSCYTEAEEKLQQVISLARSTDVFATLAPHICLVRGQFEHLVGADQAALRYYDAANALLQPGSELGLVIEMCSLACQGKLKDVKSNTEECERINELAEECRLSSSAGLSAAGWFVGSLTERNIVASKKKLSTTFEVACKANNNIMRALVFAFTTSVHLYGPVERTLRQLETGLEMAKLMGGKDRPDQVGQLALGLWFAQKLKAYRRREGNVQAHAEAKLIQEAYIKAANKQRGEG